MPNLLVSPEIWPVIHVKHRDIDLVLANAKIAVDNQCAGVLLISMQGYDSELVGMAEKVKELFPQIKVGVNHLSKKALKSLKANLQSGLDATWTDYPDVNSTHISESALQIAEIIKSNPTHLFFGSVAFKYQVPEKNPSLAALNAIGLGMIPTTSGSATGVAAETSKLKEMREALGDKPLGIASGITPENIGQHIGIITHALVATGISKDHHTLCPEKTISLMEKIR